MYITFASAKRNEAEATLAWNQEKTMTQNRTCECVQQKIKKNRSQKVEDTKSSIIGVPTILVNEHSPIIGDYLSSTFCIWKTKDRITFVLLSPLLFSTINIEFIEINWSLCRETKIVFIYISKKIFAKVKSSAVSVDIFVQFWENFKCPRIGGSHVFHDTIRCLGKQIQIHDQEMRETRCTHSLFTYSVSTSIKPRSDQNLTTCSLFFEEANMGQRILMFFALSLMVT